jgi:hypothetical protein
MKNDKAVVHLAGCFDKEENLYNKTLDGTGNHQGQ